MGRRRCPSTGSVDRSPISGSRWPASESCGFLPLARSRSPSTADACDRARHEPRAEYAIEPTEMWHQLTSGGPVNDISWYRALRRRAGACAGDIAGSWSPHERFATEVGGVRTGRRRWLSPERSASAGPPDRRAVVSERLGVHRPQPPGPGQRRAPLPLRARSNHPEINAWFVVDRDTADWARLEREGFRLVQYGTPEHLLLMLNCVELISSQVDHYIVHPVDTRRFGPRTGGSRSSSTASPRTTCRVGSTASRSAASSRRPRPSTSRSPVTTRRTSSPTRKCG